MLPTGQPEYLIDEVERLFRAELVGINAGEQLQGRAGQRGEQRHLPRGRLLRPPTGGDVRLALQVELAPLDVAQDLVGALDHVLRQPGQAGHLDAVAAVGRPLDDLAEKDDRRRSTP